MHARGRARRYALNTNRVCVRAVCIVRRNRFHGSRNYTVRNDPTAGSTWRDIRPRKSFMPPAAYTPVVHAVGNNVSDAFTRRTYRRFWVHECGRASEAF